MNRQKTQTFNDFDFSRMKEEDLDDFDLLDDHHDMNFNLDCGLQDQDVLSSTKKS